MGICYGMHLICQELGGAVAATATREYGRAQLHTVKADPLLAHVPDNTTVWMSHGDAVQSIPDNFISLAATENCPYAAIKHQQLSVWGLQFHPEVTHTPHGNRILAAPDPGRWAT